MTDLGEGQEDLGSLVNGADDPVGGVRVVGRDVIVNVPQPTLGFSRPDYFRHDSMVCFIASCETVRPASESARPRSTIRAKASSRSNSSYELSSGCLSSSSIIWAFGVAPCQLMAIL